LRPRPRIDSDLAEELGEKVSRFRWQRSDTRGGRKRQDRVADLRPIAAMRRASEAFGAHSQ